MDTDRRPASDDRRGVVAVVTATVTLSAISLVLAFTVAEGDARGHAFFHLLFAAVGLGLFVAIARMWQGSATGSTPMRTALLVLLALGITGAIVESIGASGYDRFNAGHEIEWLTTVHNAAVVSGAIGMLAFIAAVPTLITLIVVRLTQRTRPQDSSIR